MIDDGWKDNYDQWKLASPYDDEPEDDPCDHDDYEADILSGRAMCNRCGHAWWQTTEELETELRRQAEYGEWVAEQERREKWLRLTAPFRWLGHKLLPLSPRTAIRSLDTDEIPF